MFLFGCALYNTSTCCMLTLWLSCVNYALLGEFPLLHRLLQDIFTYALFWLPRVNLSLKNKLPYYTISFSWNKRLLEPKFLCDEYVPLTISSPPLHSLLTRRKRKLSFKKVKLVYLKSLQSIILLDFLERTVRKLKSFEWEKRPKAEGKMSPKILLEKNKERENRVSEEKERKRRKKKQWLHC